MLIMRLEIFTPGRDGLLLKEGFEAVFRQEDLARSERDDRDFAVPDEPSDEIAPEVVFLPGLGGREQGGHNSPRYSRMRFRVQNWSRVILPLTSAEAQLFVLPTFWPIFSRVILFLAQLRMYIWMSRKSFSLFIMYIR